MGVGLLLQPVALRIGIKGGGLIIASIYTFINIGHLLVGIFQHVYVEVLHHEVEQRRVGVRRQAVVRVDKGDDVGLAFAQHHIKGGVAGGRQSAVLWLVYHPDALWVSCCPCVAAGGCLVGRRIVNQQQLHLVNLLLQHTLNAGVKGLCRVINGYNDTQHALTFYITFNISFIRASRSWG